MWEPDRILIDRGPGEIRLGVAAGKRVLDLALLRDGLVPGTVLLGRVTGQAPGTGGMFVEIGQERAGFLPQPPKSGVKRVLGQEVLVQVRSGAAHGKGATLSTDIVFAGRWLTFAPLKTGLELSRRLPEDERERLASVLAGWAEGGGALGVRTAAQGVDVDVLALEWRALKSYWQIVAQARAAGARAPTVLWRPDPLESVLALYPKISAVAAADRAGLAALTGRWGDALSLTADGSVSAMLDDALDEALQPWINLPSGGRLGFGAMAALTAWDVDSGSGAPQAANAEAVNALVRHIRLRGLGGQMVVDFIPAGGKGGLGALAAKLRRAVAVDPVATTVLGVTPMGLVEVTRERRGPSIPELCLDQWGAPQPLAVGLSALRRVVAEAQYRPGRALTLVLAPEVEAALMSQSTAMADASARIGLPLTLKPQAGRARQDVGIEETKP